MLALGALAPAALAACVGGPDGPGGDDGAPPAPEVEFTPAVDATDVLPTSPVRLQVRYGRFQRIALRIPDGRVVAGVLDRERTSFMTTEPLGYGVTYTWDGAVIGGDGRAVPVSGSFTTVAPSRVISGQFQLADGQTVGVAAPIILQFDGAISDKAAVERALRVCVAPPVEGGWAWLPDEAGGARVHWRTREYLPAGATVRVDAPLYGVHFGDGAYGAADSTLDFAIGRRQVVRADANSHRLQVLTDVGVIMDFPCSYGEGDVDRNVTRSGIHVVTEKYEDFYMTNPAAGYANLRERFAVRISNNGEFIHANPASLGAQGSANVTNGCINLSLEDAEQYFHSALYGDPVEVTGTRIELSYADGDIWDWVISWPDWQAMSALSDAEATEQLPSTAPATPTDAPTLSGTPTTEAPATTQAPVPTGSGG